MKTADYSHLFDENYYRTGCGLPYQRSEHWLSFFGNIAANIVQEIGPRTVLDAGCAMGFLVESLRDRGVDAFGLDISEYALRRVRADVKPYCWLTSLAQPLPGRYDLIVCIEVLEHMPLVDAERAVENMCAAADDILFSSSPSDHCEPTHINVQLPEYWRERFARHGFARDLDFDAGFLNSWAVRFKRATGSWHLVVQGYERHLAQMAQERQEWHRSADDYRDRLNAQEQANVDLQALLAEKGQELQELQDLENQMELEIAALREQLAAAQAQAAEFAFIQNSLGWRAIQFLWWVRRAIAPPASRRAQWLTRLLHGKAEL